MTYEIRDLEQLAQDTNDLGANGQKISNSANDLKIIINKILESWEPSEQGQDLPGAIDTLTKIVDELNTTISPTITEYRDSMNMLYQATVETQSKTVQ